METLKREDRRTLDKAVSMMVGGAKVDVRLRNVLKLYMKEPSHKLGVHEWGMVRKFVGHDAANGAAGPVKATPFTREDKARLDEAMKLFEASPPTDVRLKAFLANYTNKRTVMMGDHTRAMLVKYLAAAKQEPKAARSRAVRDPQALGLGLSGNVEVVGPESAFAMLEVNEKIGFGNRPINKDRIGRYAHDMKSGRWRMTGEPIMIGKAGQLMNGQHRLYAVIDAEVEVPMVVIRGVDESAFSSMDQGLARRASDVIGMGNVKDATLTASTIRLLYRWEKFGPLAMMTQRRIGYGFTNETAVEMMNERPRLVDSVTMGRRCHSLCQPSVIAFCHYVCAEKSRAAADEFFEKLRTGLGIGTKKGDPIYTLRQRMISDRAPYTRSSKPEAAIRMVMRMWNAWRNGETLTRIPNLTESEIQRPV